MLLAKHALSGMSAPLKAFIVEDSPVIRENLIAALEELEIGRAHV